MCDATILDNDSDVINTDGGESIEYLRSHVSKSRFLDFLDYEEDFRTSHSISVKTECVWYTRILHVSPLHNAMISI